MKTQGYIYRVIKEKSANLRRIDGIGFGGWLLSAISLLSSSELLHTIFA